MALGKPTSFRPLTSAWSSRSRVPGPGLEGRICGLCPNEAIARCSSPSRVPMTSSRVCAAVCSSTTGRIATGTQAGQTALSCWPGLPPDHGRGADRTSGPADQKSMVPLVAIRREHGGRGRRPCGEPTRIARRRQRAARKPFAIRGGRSGIEYLSIDGTSPFRMNGITESAGHLASVRKSTVETSVR